MKELIILYKGFESIHQKGKSTVFVKHPLQFELCRFGQQRMFLEFP